MHPGWKPPESADGSGADAQPATRKSGMDGAAVSNEADRAATSALTGGGLLMEAMMTRTARYATAPVRRASIAVGRATVRGAHS